MLCILIHNDKIRGVFHSDTQALQTAHDLQDSYGDVGWDEEQLGDEEIFFITRDFQKIRVIKVDTDRLFSIGYRL